MGPFVYAGRSRKQGAHGTGHNRVLSDKPAVNAMQKLFVSWTRADFEVASRLVGKLRARSIDCFYSETDIRPGDSIPDRMSEGLAQSDKFLLIWSSQARSSPHVRNEIEAFYFKCPESGAILFYRECPVPGAHADDATRAAALEQRRGLRDRRSREIVKAIYEWALAQRALPQSTFGKAIAYMLGLWPGLKRFLDDPRIPLDNNHTERGLRGVVIGRKNHYGSRSRRGTEVAALYYSLIESAKLAGVEPKAYLRAAARAALANPGAVLLPHELLTPTAESMAS